MQTFSSIVLWLITKLKPGKSLQTLYIRQHQKAVFKKYKIKNLNSPARISQVDITLFTGHEGP
jgi:hypothetical protein